MMALIDFVSWLGFALVGLLVLYIGVRLISAAHYRSKKEFLRDLWMDDARKGDDQNGI